jgi:fucose 4-O-acetylase-like acetyltransferase
MFPFFLIGFYANYDMVLKLKSYRYNFMLVVVSLVMMFFVVPQVISIDVEMLYYADSYSKFDLSYFMIILYRVVLLVMAFMVCLSVIILIPDKELFFTKLGTNTIGIYLVHGLIFLTLMGVGFFEYVGGLNLFILFMRIIIFAFSLFIRICA